MLMGFLFLIFFNDQDHRIIRNAIYIFVNLSIVWDRVMANSPSLRGGGTGERRLVGKMAGRTLWRLFR
jgi:hypothetical protein